jgi:hypothetical protein
LLPVLLLGLMATTRLHAQELEKQATWQPVDTSAVAGLVGEWAEAAGVQPPTRAELDSAINQHPDQAPGVALDLLAEWFPFTAPARKQLASRPADSGLWQSILPLAAIRDPRLPESARAQLQLATGCWLVRHARYDEALELLTGLSLEEVVAPDELLFYRGLAQHRLLQSAECIQTLSRLLENEMLIPRRFAVVTRLMIADMEALEADSLDEVSRLMDDIRRRQALHRSGTKVIDQEKQVIDKLDQMIEELEKQMQQAAASAQGGGSSGQPMQGQGSNAPGLGKGDVTDRQLAEGGDWGSIPPQKRDAALAEMAKELPPHYREVIEEYFRQLAKESENR